ncbi:uncharacterized zinc finger protein CG2678 [Drosophila grimshawi]|nr:uncharacterized zinc finger protein CG2678 [Drosophila grimshawi]
MCSSNSDQSSKVNLEICRVCMSSSVRLVDIFLDRPLPDDQYSLADILNELVDFKVKRDDNLPKKICISCGLNAQIAFTFLRRFQQSYQLLCMLAVESDKMVEQEAESSDESEAGPEPGENRPTPQIPRNTSPKPRNRNIGSTEMIIENKNFKNDELNNNDDDLSIHSDKTVHSHGYRLRPLRRKTYFPAPTRSSKCLEESNPSTGRIFRQFKCDQCRSTFATQARLNRHKPNHSGESTVFQCKATFSSKTRMQKHACAKNKLRPHICSHCQEGFKTKSELFMHLYTYSEEH